MSDYWDNLAKLNTPDAAEIDRQRQLTGPGGILVLIEEPDPPLENVPYIVVSSGVPILKIRIAGVTHDLSLATSSGDEVAGELERIIEGQTVTVEEGRQLLLHGSLTLEGTLILNGTVSLI